MKDSNTPIVAVIHGTSLQDVTIGGVLSNADIQLADITSNTNQNDYYLPSGVHKFTPTDNNNKDSSFDPEKIVNWLREHQKSLRKKLVQTGLHLAKKKEKTNEKQQQQQQQQTSTSPTATATSTAGKEDVPVVSSLPKKLDTSNLLSCLALEWSFIADMVEDGINEFVPGALGKVAGYLTRLIQHNSGKEYSDTRTTLCAIVLSEEDQDVTNEIHELAITAPSAVVLTATRSLYNPNTKSRLSITERMARVFNKGDLTDLDDASHEVAAVLAEHLAQAINEQSFPHRGNAVLLIKRRRGVPLSARAAVTPGSPLNSLEDIEEAINGDLHMRPVLDALLGVRDNTVDSEKDEE